MMAFHSKVRNKVLSGQSREIINSVLQFMKQEADAGKPLISLVKVTERVEAATGVSRRTLMRIKKEKKAIDARERTSFATPNKNKPKIKTSKIMMDSLDRSVLRRIIHNFHFTEEQVPTLSKIYKKVCEDMGYQGSMDTINKEMGRLGFSWRKARGIRKILMERDDIRNLRIAFLKKLKMYREEGRQIVYVDETYIHSTHIHEKAWNDQSIAKEPMLIILNAGGDDGFVPGAYVRWMSNSSIEGYHNVMNYVNYEKWMKTQLIPNLRTKSVVVIDNASYHNKQVNKCPTSASKLGEMQNWLRKKNIPFDKGMLKPQLYNLIKAYKPKHKSYKIDQLIREEGHEIIRLPPYHPDLNPIEFVWVAMKEYVAARNIKFSFNRAMELCDEFFQQFSVNQWKLFCEQTKQFEEEYVEREPMVDVVMDEHLNNVYKGDSSEESEEFNDISSDDDSLSETLSGREELPEPGCSEHFKKEHITCKPEFYNIPFSN